MKIPLSKIDIDTNEISAVSRVLQSGWIMQGTVVEKFEKALSEYLGAKHVICVSSGTCALHLALLALGIGKSDEVIVPSYSFIASANSIVHAGAIPVFADISLSTYLIDPEDIKRKITKRTKAIMPVHQVGLACDMDKITSIAKQHSLQVIEDAACALGSSYHGKKIGSGDSIACFSFHPRKIITTGEGGCITTNDPKIAGLLRSLRSHGCVKNADSDHYEYIGYNYRMTDIQAAIGLSQLRKLSLFIKKRIHIAQTYSKEFSRCPLLIPPVVPRNYVHTFQSYILRIQSDHKTRDRIVQTLCKLGISAKSGVVAIHREPVYRKMLAKGDLQNTEIAADQAILLPLYPSMSVFEQRHVISTVMKLVDTYAKN